MNSSNLFRYVRLSTEPETTAPAEDLFQKIYLKEEAAGVDSLKHVHDLDHDGQLAWAEEFRKSSELIRDYSGLSFVLEQHFDGIRYPDLPNGTQLTSPLPQDLQNQDDYRTDLQRLLGSVLSARLLKQRSRSRMVVEFLYKIYWLLPRVDRYTGSIKAVLIYGFKSDIAPTQVEEVDPGREVEALREEAAELERAKKQLMDKEAQHEQEVCEQQEKLKESKSELVRTIREHTRKPPDPPKTKHKTPVPPFAAREELAIVKKRVRTARVAFKKVLRLNPANAITPSTKSLLVKYKINASKSVFTTINSIDAYLGSVNDTLNKLEAAGCCSDFPSIDANVDSIELLGIGDLIVVEDRLLKYEVGEVSHIDNILQGESKSREHRYLKVREQIVEVLEEEESEVKSELETTSRFELNKEIQSQLNTRLNSDVGASGGGSYGPVANFEASAAVSVGVDANLSINQSDSFSREVVSKAVEEIRAKSSSKTVHRTSIEIEDKNTHAFDNTTGTDHVTGVYCYIDRLSCAQPYRYGKRLMLLAYIADPAKDIRCMAKEADTRRFLELDAPPSFDVRLETLTANTFLDEAEKYKVGDVQPPPDLYTFKDKVFKTDQTSAQQAELSLNSVVEFIFPFFQRYKKWSITDKIEVPAGYEIDAVTVTVNHGSNGMSLPAGVLGALVAAPAAINAAGIPFALASLMMPATQYSLDSSSVTVCVGNESKKSQFFFFDSELVIDTLVDMAEMGPQQVENLQGTMNTLQEDLNRFVTDNLSDFFTDDLPSAANDIVSSQVSQLQERLTTFINSVQTLYGNIVSIAWNPPPIPQLSFNWSAMTTSLNTQRDLIADTLASATEITEEFATLLGTVNNDLIQPFIAIFQQAIGTIANGLNTSFVNPLQDLAELFESSDVLTFSTQGSNQALSAKGSIPISLNILASSPGITTNVVVRLKRTARATQIWQLETYNKLYQGHVRLMEAYEASLYTSNFSSKPRANPALLRQLENDEIKKFSVRTLHRRSNGGSPTILPEKLTFFDHAIEWENLSFKTSYFGVSCDDLELLDNGLQSSADQQHVRFLKAKAAYVLLPVRVEYTQAVLGYMKSGDWQEPELDAEDAIALYQEIILGMNLQENPTKLGEPILVRQPTSLIILQKDLPKNADTCDQL